MIAAAGVLKLQNRTLTRAEKMKAFGGASQQVVDQSTSDQMTAEGALKSARDAVRIFGKTDEEIDKIIAERKADPRLIVKSPMTGYVTTRNAAPGLFVQPGVPRLRLSPSPTFRPCGCSRMSRKAERRICGSGRRSRRSVAAYPDRAFDGEVTVLGPSVDPNTRRMFVRSEIADPATSVARGNVREFHDHRQ